YLSLSVVAFVVFSMVASSVYVINDIRDVESDRKHEVKCHRPIASGKVSIIEAKIILAVLILFVSVAEFLLKAPLSATFVLGIYFLSNIFYSVKLKKVPIVDISILTLGFLLRVFYGANVIGVAVSNWLYLTVMALAFYLGLGKRRNELLKMGADASEVRGVLKYYNHSFLDKNMYMLLSAAIVFYALWCIDPITTAVLNEDFLIWTVFLVVCILMKYSLDIETGSYADPVDVVLGDKWLICLVLLYCVILLALLYGGTIV
ncbi:MAG: UbiA prenyltransferase family protein, partial [Peptococcaceae bacterium]